MAIQNPTTSNALTNSYLSTPRKNAPTEPHPITNETIPTVLGHEWSGTISEIGPDVPDNYGLRVGKKCVIFPVLGDRTCLYCQQSLHGACPNWGFLGYSGSEGGFAEYCCVDARDVLVIPDSMGLDVAALVEPISVGWHAVKRSEVKPEDAVLVMGAGPIGIAVILSLQALGVRNISVSEVSGLRSERAKGAGARFVFNPMEDDIVNCSKDASGDGYGPQVIYECAGVQASMEVAIQSIRGGGTIMNIGVFEKELTLNWNLLNRRSLRYVGSNIYTKDEFREVIDAIADGKSI